MLQSRSSRHASLGLAVCVLALLGITPAAPAQTQSVTVGGTRVEVSPRRGGLRIEWNGVTVSAGSDMVVTTPPWTPHYYLGPEPAALGGAERVELEDGVELRLSHRGRHDAFLADDVIRVRDGVVEREFTGRFTKEEGAALLQWRMAALNPTLLVGRRYTAKLRDGSQVSGVAPVKPLSGDRDATTLANDFTWIEFDSRIGPLRIEVDSREQIICYDQRGSRWADPTLPMFWLGELDTRITRDQPVRFRIVFKLPPTGPGAVTPRPINGHARVRHVADAKAQNFDQPPVIVPRPKRATFGDGLLRLTAAESLRALAPNGEAPADAALAIQELRRFARDTHALELGTAATADDPLIRFVSASDLRIEGYRLRVASDHVEIAAGCQRGFLYAVQTLKQLAATGPDDDLVFRLAEIEDWPSLAYRGVHFFTGGQGPDLQIKLIRNLLGALKMNELVLESEYIKWDSQPNIHHPEYGMDKSEVRAILAAAQAVGVRVTPLVMSLGHCQWMFYNDQNLELAEDPDAKWAYCVTNPATYDFIFTVYQEAVDLFQPDYFHIGHDEFTERGRVPYRESSKPYTPKQLFLMDTLRHHAWFRERDIKLMMWGDMLLGPGEGPDACHADSVEEAQLLRDKLPKDIVITDWHYADVPPERFVNLDKFHEDGFETIAATWHRPGNIVNFAKAAHDKQSRGLLQTTWAGYSLDPSSFAREMHQYALYVLAAEAAWNADNPPAPADIDYGQHFLRLMDMTTLKPGRSAGWVASLQDAANVSLTATNADGWFGLGPEHDLSRVPHGDVRLGGVQFHIAPDRTGAAATGVALHSKLSTSDRFPTRVQFRVDDEADELVFLHTMSFPASPGELVGRYELLREDGGVAHVELRYGENIFAANDLQAAAAAPIVWTGETPAGQHVALRAFVWKNPRPEQRIRAVAARSMNPTASLVWLGVTGLNATPREN